jgi:hypothetical protein
MVKHDGNFNHQSGWWLMLTSLKNDGVRQLGWRHSQIWKKCSKPPTSSVQVLTNQLSCHKSTIILNLYRPKNHISIVGFPTPVAHHKIYSLPPRHEITQMRLPWHHAEVGRHTHLDAKPSEIWFEEMLNSPPKQKEPWNPTKHMQWGCSFLPFKCDYCKRLFNEFEWLLSTTMEHKTLDFHAVLTKQNCDLTVIMIQEDEWEPASSRHAWNSPSILYTKPNEH